MASTRGELQSRDLQIEALESRLATSQEELTSRDLQVETLRVELVDSKEAMAHLSIQMSVVKTVHDQAWGYSYKEGLDRLRDFDLVSLQADR